MPRKSILPKTTAGRNLVLFAIFSSLFSLVTSGLTAYNDQAFQGLHTFSLAIMLVAYLGVIFSKISERRREKIGVRVKPIEQKTSKGDSIYQISPSHFSSFVFLEPPTTPGQTPGAEQFADEAYPWIDKINSSRRNRVVAAVVRNAYVDYDIVEQLLGFPNLVIIDFQGCTVDHEIWSDLAQLDQLEYLAVFGAVNEQTERELHYALPEVKTINEPVQLIHSSPDTI